jgi:hypothetical protein
MAFELKSGEGVIFEEIIGVGPLLVEDEEGRVLLKMDMVKPGSKGGYQAPCIFSSLSNDGSFADTTQISYGRAYKGKRQQNLILDQKTTTAICNLYSESEYRVYIPKKRDLVFKAKDIESIVLPNYFLGADFELNIELLVEILCKGKYNLSKDKTEAIKQLQNDFILNSGKNLNDSSYDLIKGLIDLLQGDYQHTIVEILQVAADENLKTKASKVTTYQRDNTKTDDLPTPGKDNKFTGSDKTRYVVDIDDSKISINVAYPRLNEAKIVP